jgi:hypothetical protein
MFPELELEQIQYVAQAIREALSVESIRPELSAV